MQKTVILNQNRDFLQLYRRGRKIVSPYMILYVRKNRRKYNRLGITVGKKVGCASSATVPAVSSARHIGRRNICCPQALTL